MDEILKKYIFISLIFIINFNCATAMSIDEQIEVIKKAPESERVKLMNQFKRQLILMNQQQRESAINRLKNGKTEAHTEIKSNTFINNMQSSSIEQNIQIAKDVIIREHIKIPNIPTITQPQTVPTVQTPTVEQPQTVPTVQTPTVEQPQTVPTVQTPTVEQPQTVPTVQTPTVEQPQSVPTVQTPAVEQTQTPAVEQPQSVPNSSTPTVEQPQGVPNGSNSTGLQGGLR